MKILALEKEIPGTTSEHFQPFLKQEARKVWELLQKDIIREIYFRQDRSAAVLILECSGVSEAEAILHSLPLFQENLIEFEIIPLAPYSGLERIFKRGEDAKSNSEGE